MGQYYQPTLKQKGSKDWKSFLSWDFGVGLKLMEHSYINNPLVCYVKKQILNTPTQVVWAGDYADNEKGKDENLYTLVETTKPKYKRVSNRVLKQMRYLVNETKKQYVDYSKVKADDWGYRIDPLSLLTAEGNGRGGGDYHGTNMELVGSWARDIISVESEIPNGYTELIPNFVEGADDDIKVTETMKGSNLPKVSKSMPKKEDEDEMGSLLGLGSALGIELLEDAIGISGIGGSFGGGSTSGGGAGAKW